MSRLLHECHSSENALIVILVSFLKMQAQTAWTSFSTFPVLYTNREYISAYYWMPVCLQNTFQRETYTLFFELDMAIVQFSSWQVDLSIHGSYVTETFVGFSCCELEATAS